MSGISRVTGARAIMIIVLGIASFAASAQQDFSKAKIATVPVADDIYMLVGPGGNIGVSIGEDGVLLIDDQFGPLSDKIKAAIAALTDQSINFVINTHWHGDHTGGNEAFANEGALIVAHDNVRVRMSKPFFSKFFNSESPASPEAALPVVTFNDALRLYVNGHTIQAQHVLPAHTDGDSIIWFREANVVHMGDTFFNGLMPFIDGASGGSIDGMIAAVENVMATINADTKIMPGHGPLTDADGLKAFHTMLKTVAGRMRQMIEEGRSLEEIIAAKPTAEFDAKWGNGFIKPDQWVELVHGTMTGE